MNSAMKLLRTWIDHRRLQPQCSSLEWRLSREFGETICLIPAKQGGGQDRLFFAQTCQGQPQTVCCVRLTCPWKSMVIEPSGLPRQSPRASRRIAHEVQAYNVLHPLSLSPEVIAHDSHFLVNTFFPWRRLADVLRESSQHLWTVLPVLLRSIQQMHQAGIAHLDLNCGNVLVSPSLDRTVFIDFEYGPQPDLSFFDQQRFDFLRIAHSLLQRRRGREAIWQSPERFADLFARHAPESGEGIPGPMERWWFSHIAENSVIWNSFREAFGFSGDSGPAGPLQQRFQC